MVGDRLFATGLGGSTYIYDVSDGKLDAMFANSPRPVFINHGYVVETRIIKPRIVDRNRLLGRHGCRAFGGLISGGSRAPRTKEEHQRYSERANLCHPDQTWATEEAELPYDPT